MKIIKLIPVIIKNLILIIFYELKQLWRKSGKAKWIMSLLALGLVAGGGYRIWNGYYFDPNSEDLSLSQAARVGEMTTHRLMIELKGIPDNLPGQYERGDIVFIKPANFQFTEEEKTKFAILNMNLTEKQAEIMTRSLSETKKDASGQPEKISLKRRKYAVRLWRVGIWGDDQKGRVTDKVYGWGIVYEK
jgi:hypothetical protein